MRHLRKPRIVMFGEDLPDRFWDLQEEDLQKCATRSDAARRFRLEWRN